MKQPASKRELPKLDKTLRKEINRSASAFLQVSIYPTIRDQIEMRTREMLASRVPQSEINQWLMMVGATGKLDQPMPPGMRVSAKRRQGNMSKDVVVSDAISS